jgi:hypothetical protein
MLPHIRLEQNAMNRFVERFTSSIVAVLGCFDRVIFKGYLPIRSDSQLNGFVDHGLKMRRKDFLPFVEKQSHRLVEHTQAMAQKAGVPYLSRIEAVPRPLTRRFGEQVVEQVLRGERTWPGRSA